MYKMIQKIFEFQFLMKRFAIFLYFALKLVILQYHITSMSKQNTQPKPLTPEQKKLKENKQKHNAQIVCSFMLFALGIITSPKLLGFFLQKDLFPKDFQVPSLLTYFALTGGFMLILTIIVTLMRILGKKPSPAIIKDSPSIISINQALKNTIIYNTILMGLYFYLQKNWKKEGMVLELSPFIILGGLVFDLIMRLFELAIGAKGFRYLAQAIIVFFLLTLAAECLTTI